MSLYPDVQRKAQKELDRVVGPNRLPDFDDYENLVYIRAVALECMRWMPVTPMGVPHTVIRDDEYRGFLIPKGTMVIAVSIILVLKASILISVSQNQWWVFILSIAAHRIIIHVPWYRAMLHNSVDYPEPERFNPDRFIKDDKLNPNVRDPTTLSFGFGRRYVSVFCLTFSPVLLMSRFRIASVQEDG